MQDYIKPVLRSDVTFAANPTGSLVGMWAGTAASGTSCHSLSQTRRLFLPQRQYFLNFLHILSSKLRFSLMLTHICSDGPNKSRLILDTDVNKDARHTSTSSHCAQNKLPVVSRVWPTSHVMTQMGVGFMCYSAASHRGAIVTLSLHFCEVVKFYFIINDPEQLI